MPLIEWNETLSVGIKEIDEQHKKLISMINKLHNAMKQGKGKYVIESIFNDLIDYVKTHFETEEKYFAKYNYPLELEHKEEHKQYTQQVLEYKKQFENNKIGISITLLRFLKNWLQNHIKGTDMKYVDFFKSKGLE